MSVINRHIFNFIILLLCAPLSAAANDVDHDDFAHVMVINKASLVMLAEQKLLPPELAKNIATATLQIEAEQREPGAERSNNYLVFEERLLQIAGSEASRLHTGRSRQDIGSTYRRMALRESALQVYAALLETRAVLIDFAGSHVNTIIPAYTHGVQAQPTSLAHYLLAFSAAFERDAERLEGSYSRLNLSPLGAAALGTSGFAIDRERLAGLLGFEGLVENSYDANLVSSVDSKIEFANTMATSAIVVGQLMQNLHTQYHSPSPWFLLAEEVTDVSSIMPQKRNPRPLDLVRLLASSVVSASQAVTMNAHNTNSGMNDYRPARQTLETAAYARQMYAAYQAVFASLEVNPQRALDEINADYSTMTEVADTLLRNAGVPFRVAHHYASELTEYGRTHNKRPMDLSDAELSDIYLSANGTELPVSVAVIRAAMDPQQMVEARKGIGGPQPSEVDRMLSEHRESLLTERQWLAARQKSLEVAAAKLDKGFKKLL